MQVISLKKFDEVEKSSGLILVDFSAEGWCAPCKAIKPILEELESEIKDVRFVKVDVDTEQELTEKYEIVSVPTLILFKNGKEVSRKTGFADKQRLTKWLNKYLKVEDK